MRTILSGDDDGHKMDDSTVYTSSLLLIFVLTFSHAFCFGTGLFEFGKFLIIFKSDRCSLNEMGFQSFSLSLNGLKAMQK